MSELNVELCPETGICSIIRGDGSKVDLMPDEVNGIRDVSASPDDVRQALADVDSTFAAGLETDDVAQILKSLG